MIELNINNLCKFYGANKIFEHISFEVKTGERIGLIGTNGCGKTTLMKILMGEEDYQEGIISYRKGTKVGYLNQIPVFEANTTVIDVLQLAFQEVFEVKRQMVQLEYRMSTEEGDTLDKTVKLYSRLMEQYEHRGGYEIETKITKISEGLQISDAMLNMQFDLLSGGEKTRVILAKILLEEPDILLLDEPTNHLDLVTIQWLEDFLRDYKGASVIISHDRFFLDNVVLKIIELEFDHAELYAGNYSYYVIEKERRFLLELKNYQNQQKKIERMEQQIQRYRIWGEMRDSDKMFRRAKELEKRLSKVDVLGKPIKDKRKIRLQHNNIERSGRIVVDVSEVSKAYGDMELLCKVNFTLFYQDSACIIGNNGCGKTTLLKMILDEFEPDNGIVKLGAQVKIGYLPQQVEYPDEELTVLEYFTGMHNIAEGVARAQLAKVLFIKEDVNKKIKFLSGGEKSRLKLCSLTFTGVNVLILDEPTNHLDIDSREVLEEMLCGFEGTLLFVSHDRYFINKVADKILAIEDKKVTEYAGDYSYYLEEYQKAIDKLAEQKIIPQQVNRSCIKQSEKDTPQINKANITSSEKGTFNPKSETHIRLTAKRADQLERYIEELEGKRSELEQQMRINNTNSILLYELSIEIEKVEKELYHAYVDWENVLS